MNIKGIFNFIIFSIICIYFFSTDFLNNIIGNILKTTKTGDTLTIRSLGREFYISELESNKINFIFGMGIPDYNLSSTYYKLGMDKNYFLDDNGIYGYAYIYGILGITVILLMLLKYFLLSIRCLKENIVPLMYLIYTVIVFPNIILWYWSIDGIFMLIIMLCVVEYIRKEDKRYV